MRIFNIFKSFTQQELLMRILHTADWHIGQLFHEYDRTYEHQKFLDWLQTILQSEAIDVLLVSGDVFDISNPAAASIKMFYQFINNATKANPSLQIIITAGNHDSASRLEAPKPLLESSKVHIIGLVQKNVDGEIDYEQLTIPIYNSSNEIALYCLAIPFLRMGDYPSIKDCANPYTEGVTALYNHAFNHAKSVNLTNVPIIAMGHLHTHAAELTDLDKTERLIMGGAECIPATAFPEELKYVALGHIHKAQRIGGKEHIRYSGSVLPMSFSELNYKHQVIVFDLEDEVINISSIEIPEAVPLLRVPLKHQPLHEVLSELELLPLADAFPETSPFLEVRVLLDGPEPALRHKVETVLQGKKVRLAKIDTKYPSKNSEEVEYATAANLNELKPLDVFLKTYQHKYNTEVPNEIMSLFNHALQQVNHKDE